MIYRVDVRTEAPARNGEAGGDPLGEAICHQIQEFGARVGRVLTRRIFLIDTDATREQVLRIARELLADPIIEQAEVVEDATTPKGFSLIEVHLKPGVMDPVA